MYFSKKMSKPAFKKIIKINQKQKKIIFIMTHTYWLICKNWKLIYQKFQS